MAGFVLRVPIRETIAKQSGHTTEVSGTAGEKTISIGKKTAEYQKKRKAFGRGHLRHDHGLYLKKREGLAPLSVLGFSLIFFTTFYSQQMRYHPPSPDEYLTMLKTLSF